MQQINLLQNNKSMFWIVVSFVVPKTGLIHLVLVGLIAGRQADRSLIILKKFKCCNSTSNAFLDGYIDFQDTSSCTNRLTASDFYEVVFAGVCFWEL